MLTIHCYNEKATDL